MATETKIDEHGHDVYERIIGRLTDDECSMHDAILHEYAGRVILQYASEVARLRAEVSRLQEPIQARAVLHRHALRVQAEHAVSTWRRRDHD